MKKEVHPTMIVLGVVVALAVVGGLYYRFLGAGAPRSNVASPQGLPTSAADLMKPLPTGSGRNSITGEPLPATAAGAQLPAGMTPPTRTQKP